MQVNVLYQPHHSVEHKMSTQKTQLSSYKINQRRRKEEPAEKTQSNVLTGFPLHDQQATFCIIVQNSQVRGVVVAAVPSIPSYYIYIGRWWWHAGRGVFRSCHREIMKKRQKNARWQLHTPLVEHRHWWAWCVVLQQVV